MPSLFAKFTGSSKSNPYQNPHHPSHAPIPKVPPKTIQPTSSDPPQRPLPGRASPRGSRDFLAEARQLAGRDPVTGLRRQDAITSVPAPRSDARQDVNVAAEQTGESSAYVTRAAKTKPTTGSKYDLFVQLMAEKRIKEEIAAGAIGKAEFYAPERKVEEFYSHGVRD